MVDSKCSPIFKTGNKGSCENYRPVSLASQVCKSFEYIKRDAVMMRLESDHLIKESQHGFRHGRSCLSNLLSFLDKVTRCIDDGDTMDFAKAFDKVRHEILMQRIKAHGIGGKISA